MIIKMLHKAENHQIFFYTDVQYPTNYIKSLYIDDIEYYNQNHK